MITEYQHTMFSAHCDTVTLAIEFVLKLDNQFQSKTVQWDIQQETFDQWVGNQRENLEMLLEGQEG